MISTNDASVFGVVFGASGNPADYCLVEHDGELLRVGA